LAKTGRGGAALQAPALTFRRENAITNKRTREAQLEVRSFEGVRLLHQHLVHEHRVGDFKKPPAKATHFAAGPCKKFLIPEFDWITESGANCGKTFQKMHWRRDRLWNETRV
jgi:hypothetical protein